MYSCGSSSDGKLGRAYTNTNKGIPTRIDTFNNNDADDTPLDTIPTIVAISTYDRH